MPKLHDSVWIVAVWLKNDFLFVSQRRSHAKYRKVGNPTRTVIVPVGQKEIPIGTFRSVLRQASLDETDFN